MKKIDPLHVLFSCAAIWVVALVGIHLWQPPSAHAAGIVSSNMVTYATQSTGTTNNGRAVLIGTAYIATAPSFVISDGGIVTGTNGLLVNIKYGLGTNIVNASTVASYSKATTNAEDGVVTPAGITLSVYAFTEVIAVTNATVGTKAIFNNP